MPLVAGERSSDFARSSCCFSHIRTRGLLETLSFLGETQVPFIENDRVIANLNGHFAGNYLGEETLITVAAWHGYNPLQSAKSVRL